MQAFAAEEGAREQFASDTIGEDYATEDQIQEHDHDHDQDYASTEIGLPPPLALHPGTPQTRGPKAVYWYCCGCGYGPHDEKYHTGCANCQRRRCARCKVSKGS